MENSNSSKSPRNRMIFERGVVGLGIVAAMSITNINNSTDVVSSAKPAANFRGTTSYDIFYASPLRVNIGTRFLFPTPHFLNSCNLCHKHLHGVDIFIYRGEKAFCSAECRETHIRNDDDDDDDDDDYEDKCRSRVMKVKPLDCSIPPSSAAPVSLPAILAA